LDISCNINKDYPAWTWLPHMHDLGTHIKIDHISGGVTTNLFDIDWDPSMTFHPPTSTADPTTPHVFKAGDQVKVHCDFMANPAGTDVTFGREMCLMFAATVNSIDEAAPSIACDAGQWGTF
jgi:hypothetical protein